MDINLGMSAARQESLRRLIAQVIAEHEKRKAAGEAGLQETQAGLFGDLDGAGEPAGAIDQDTARGAGAQKIGVGFGSDQPSVYVSAGDPASELGAINEELNSQVRDMGILLDRQIENTRKARDQRDASEVKAKRLRAELDALRADQPSDVIAALQRTVQQQEERHKRICDGLIHKANETAAALERERARVAQPGINLSVTMAQNRSFSEKIATLEKQVVELSSALEHEAGRVADLLSVHEKANAIIKRSNEKIDDLSDKAESGNKQVAELSAALEATRSQKDAAASLNGDYRQALSRRDQEYSQLYKAFGDYKIEAVAKIESLSAQVSSRNNQVAELVAKLENESSERIHAECVRNDYRRALEQKTQEYEAFVHKNNHTNSENASAINELALQKNRAETMAASYKEALSQADVKLSTEQSRRHEIAEKLEEAQSELRELNARLRVSRTYDLEKEVEGLKTNVATQTGALEALQQQRAEWIKEQERQSANAQISHELIMKLEGKIAAQLAAMEEARAQFMELRDAAGSANYRIFSAIHKE